jgi:hypothetical protein
MPTMLMTVNVPCSTTSSFPAETNRPRSRATTRSGTAQTVDHEAEIERNQDRARHIAAVPIHFAFESLDISGLS